jgi:hypothetical protein
MKESFELGLVCHGKEKFDRLGSLVLRLREGKES